MPRTSGRLHLWAALVTLAVGGLVMLIVGLPTYMSATATRLHPQPQSSPSVMRSVPSPAWGTAVARARQVLRAGLAEQNLPGLSVAVAAGGDIVWAEGFGWADIDDRLPVGPETQFRIGTASIVLTSAAAGVLLDKGALNLDDEIQTYVPQFPKKQWPITLRQLMGHVAGVRSDSGDEGPLFSQRCERPVEALQHFADRDLLFPPGTQFKDSKYGWIVASAAIEAAAHQPFLAFVREHIFQPLGMARTAAESATGENPDHAGEPGEHAPFLTFFRQLIPGPPRVGSPKTAPATGASPDRATFYFPRFAADPRYGLHLMRPLNLSCYAGSMAFLSNPADLVRFALAIEQGKLLQPATVQLLQTPQRLTSGQETGYGLGWDVDTVALAGEPTQAFGYDGESLGGTVVSLRIFKDRGLVVAVMSNISYADTPALALKIAEAFAR
jgi:CubicO group peptidase (beta-lactamase class C family)